MKNKIKSIFVSTLLILIFLVLLYFFREQSFGIFYLFIFFLIFIVLFRFSYSKGNIEDYNLKEFSLIWKDNFNLSNKTNSAPIKLTSNVKRNLIIFIISSLILVVIFLTVNPFNKPIDTQNINYVQITLAIFVFLVFAIAIFSLVYTLSGFLTHFSNKTLLDNNLHAYKEGIKYLNYFIEWKNVKTLSYPKSFNPSKPFRILTYLMIVGSNRNYPQSFTNSILDPLKTLRIEDSSGKVYLVQLNDKKGFESALSKLNKKLS